MNVIVTANQTHVSFETHVSYSVEELRLFLDSLAPWLRSRVSRSASYIYADIPIAVLNRHLPYGQHPVRFLWNILIDAHYQVTCSPSAY